MIRFLKRIFTRYKCLEYYDSFNNRITYYYVTMKWYKANMKYNTYNLYINAIRDNEAVVYEIKEF
jgi:hypothetical protein